MSRETSAAIVVAVLVVAVLVVALAGGIGGSVKTSIVEDVDPGRPDPAATTWVMSCTTVEDGSFSLFGLGKDDPTYVVTVLVRVSAACAERLRTGGRDWPAPHAECASELRAPGEISGFGGLGPWGEHASPVVTVEVSQSCFDMATEGAPWPERCP